MRQRHLRELGGENAPEALDGLELVLVVLADAEHEHEDHGPKAAANAVEEGQAEDLRGAAADHRSGQSAEGLTRAPLLWTARRQ